MSQACVSCETEIPTNAKFCGACGTLQAATEVVSSEFEKELAMEHASAAKENIIRKRAVEALNGLPPSPVHKKFFNSQCRGKKISTQIVWHAFSVVDHWKDKKHINQVQQQKATINRGLLRKSQTVVTDVKVNTLTVKYDFLRVRSISGEEHEYRLTDMNLKKFSPGDVIVLGWLSIAEKGSDAIEYGQKYEKKVQPCAYLTSKSSNGSSDFAGWIRPEQFHNFVHSNTIGWFNLIWMGGVAGFFLLDTNYNWQLLAACFAYTITLGIARIVKGRQMKRAFNKWYESSIARACENRQQIMAKLRIKYS
jgi:hypothetical protein